MPARGSSGAPDWRAVARRASGSPRRASRDIAAPADRAGGSAGLQPRRKPPARRPTARRPGQDALLRGATTAKWSAKITGQGSRRRRSCAVGAGADRPRAGRDPVRPRRRRTSSTSPRRRGRRAARRRFRRSTALRSGGRPTARRAGRRMDRRGTAGAASGYRFGIARPLSARDAPISRPPRRAISPSAWPRRPRHRRHGPAHPAAGAQRPARSSRARRGIADGDLATRVPVSSKDEFGRLAASFNRMAEQLAENQERLLAEERRRKEEEISRRLLAAENERRRRELEEAREFQLSLLPRELPRRAGLDLAVAMTTATEVGGDYYDFLDAADGALVLAVGDATGHGAAAGTMVTAVKRLFAGRAAEASRRRRSSPRPTPPVHRMGLVRRAMALDRGARSSGRRVTLSAAGMPPVLHFRAATGRGRRDRARRHAARRARRVPVRRARRSSSRPATPSSSSPTACPSCPTPAGEPFGYERLRAALRDPRLRLGERRRRRPRSHRRRAGAAAAPPPTT